MRGRTDPSGQRAGRQAVVDLDLPVELEGRHEENVPEVEEEPVEGAARHIRYQ